MTGNPAAGFLQPNQGRLFPLHMLWYNICVVYILPPGLESCAAGDSGGMEITMKKTVFAAGLILPVFMSGLAVNAADIATPTSRSGMKVFLTLIVLLLAVTAVSFLFSGQSARESKKKTLLFAAAATGLAILGSLIGLLAAMTVTVITERMFTASLNTVIRLLITLLAGGTIVFLETRFEAARLLRFKGTRLNLLSLAVALLTNPLTCILVFELINRLIK